MPTWPRTILPAYVSPFTMPAPLISRGETGSIQARRTTSIGRRWVERYPALLTSDPAVLGFLAFINDCAAAGTKFDIVHLMYQTARGTLGGTPRVKGANQTGSVLEIDGCANSVSNWLRAGDLLGVAGLVQAFDNLEDVNTDGSGNATLRINPPIFAGNSPADNALITTSGVVLRAMLADPPKIPAAGPDQFLEGLELSFVETP